MNKILLIYALIILNINTINSEEVNTQLQQQNTNNNVINNQQQVNNNPNELSVSKSNIDQNQTIQNNNQINTLGTSAPQQQVKNINVIDVLFVLFGYVQKGKGIRNYMSHSMWNKYSNYDFEQLFDIVDTELKNIKIELINEDNKQLGTKKLKMN